jgi:choline dehydrogenase-like flavoprotein
LLNNDTFWNESLAEYYANKTGPITVALNNQVVFLPLNMTHSSPGAYLSKLAAQAAGDHLPSDYPASVIAGYVAQKKVLGKLYASDLAAVYETPFSGACSRTMVIQKPLSRGTIHINSSNPTGSPIINFRTYSNPLDVELAIEFIKFTRKYINTPTLAPLGPVETGPGANVTDSEALERWIHATSGPTSFHVSGTAAMMPRELGGVVSPDLKVYGVQGLSIVDASIIPLIPSTHLSATVYAIAEKVYKNFAHIHSTEADKEMTGCRYHQDTGMSVAGPNSGQHLNERHRSTGVYYRLAW